MEKVSPVAGLHSLGTISISSLNQIGERIKYDIKRNVFILAKHGTAFVLAAHVDEESGLDDFRRLESIKVSLAVSGKLLAVNLRDHSAVLIDPTPDGRIPPNAVFHYQRKRFDRFSASLSYQDGSEVLWLRHSNSRLRFDAEGIGASFVQDASFLFRPADRDSLFRSSPGRTKAVIRAKRVDEDDKQEAPTDPGLTKVASGYFEDIENRIDKIMQRINVNDDMLKPKRKMQHLSPA